MSGFDRIEFSPAKKAVSAKGDQVATTNKQTDFGMKARKKQKIKIPKKLPAILGVVVALLVLIAIPAYATYQSGLKTYRQAKLIGAALKQQNVKLVSDEITKTEKDLKDTKSKLGWLIPLKFVPLLSFYYNDAEHLLNAADYGLDSAKIAADAVVPYADVLGLKGEGSFAAGSAEDRIKMAVMTTGKITPQIDKIAVSMEKVQKEVDQVDPNHYPTFIFGKKIKSQLSTLKTVTDEAATFVTDARPLVKVLPSLLGESAPKKYLILFQNDKELRPTGGFITGYSIFKVDKGIITPENNDDIYNLDSTIPNKPKAPAAILRYLPNVYSLNLRDSNMSPDFMVSMKTFRSLYEQSPRSEDVDGIIAIDTNVLVKVIKILDDEVTAGGITFNTKKDPRCDCPQVIYELENNISRPVNYVRTDRKSLLGDLLNAILVKALSSSPKKYWGPLFQTIISQTQQKHILFDLYDTNAQKGIEALNAAGQIRPFDGDYLNINEANFSGAKVNIFMQEAVDNSYDVKSDGSIEKTVTIHYKNPHPPSDCNLERAGLCLNALYRDWIRVYVPKGSELIDAKGSQVKVTTYDDLGKTVFDGFITVRPQGVATYTLKYKLPFKLKHGSPLPVMIQKQSGTFDNKYTVIINGKTIESFPLLTDKVFKLDL